MVNKKTQLVNKKTQLINEKTQLINKKTQLVNKKAQLVNKKAQLVNKKAQLVNEKTQLVNKKAQLVNEKIQFDLINKKIQFDKCNLDINNLLLLKYTFLFKESLGSTFFIENIDCRIGPKNLYFVKLINKLKPLLLERFFLSNRNKLPINNFIRDRFQKNKIKFLKRFIKKQAFKKEIINTYSAGISHMLINEKLRPFPKFKRYKGVPKYIAKSHHRLVKSKNNFGLYVSNYNRISYNFIFKKFKTKLKIDVPSLLKFSRNNHNLQINQNMGLSVKFKKSIYHNYKRGKLKRRH